MKNIVIALYCLLFSFSLFAQDTLVLSSGSKCAVRHDLPIDKAGRRKLTVNNNYDIYPFIRALAWTRSGYAASWRSLIKVDLTEIPSNATVAEATLYLYSDSSQTDQTYYNSMLSGSNAVYFDRLTSDWSSSTVTWANCPSVDTEDRVWVPQSVASFESRAVDLTDFVQEWVSDSTANFGVRMSLEYESAYRSRIYGSTDHTNTNIHPKLEIIYEVPDPPDTTCSWLVQGDNLYYDQGGVSIGLDTVYDNYALAVDGKIAAEEVVVKNSGYWPDYVFRDDYPLRSLEELEKYIEQNKHLPGIPDEHEIAEHGINLSRLNKSLLEKIEELTLYLIELDKEREMLKTQRMQLLNKIEQIKTRQ